jgi:excisionase family DNA binding protein
MKNISKNRTDLESYSVSEAAAVLGVSNPTLKRMVAEGRVKAYRTPGGHLRILTESLNAMREGERLSRRSVADVSPALQIRREHLQELTLEVEEHRTRRELDRLRSEEQDKLDHRRAEAESRQQEAAQRQEEIELERERLQRQEAEEQRQREAEQQLAAFRSRWLHVATEFLKNRTYAWLNPIQRKEVLESLEEVIESRQPTDDHRYIATVIVRTLQAALEPFEAERKAQERRQRLTEAALWRLPGSATEAERVGAISAVREALKCFDATAGESEMRVAAQQAIEPISRAVERRLLEDRLLSWAVIRLPWGATDHDKARVRRECAEILADLPNDFTENEGREALEPTIQEAIKDINQRKSEKDRLARKSTLVQQGIAGVSSYLLDLRLQGHIPAEDYSNREFAAELQQEIRGALETELSGSETPAQVKEKVGQIIDHELFGDSPPKSAHGKRKAHR